MYSRLSSFIEKHNLLFQYQLGFRQTHSSYMALMIMMDKITAAMDRGDLVVRIFLDFSKAFDTVNHEILLDELYHYGIRGTALDWFKSYLCDRKQFITYDSVSSNTKVISCGIPQGSILGPLIFLIYIQTIFLICAKNLHQYYLWTIQIYFFLWKTVIWTWITYQWWAMQYIWMTESQ